MTLSEQAKLAGTSKGFKVNDVSGPVLRIKWVNGIKKRDWICPFYAVWINIFKRCFSKSYLKENPTYVGVHVCDEWFKFSNFKAWMLEQKWGADLQLDKDILNRGTSSQYSPETCAFIPKKLNVILSDSRAARGDLPLGVSYGNFRREDSKNKFVASLHVAGKQKALGWFPTAELAHKAWQEGKIEVILGHVRWYEEQSCFRSDVRGALMSRVEALKSSIESGVITQCL